MDNILNTIWDFLAIYGMKVIGSIIILIVGLWVAKLIKKSVRNSLKKKDIEETLVSFTATASYVAVVVFVILAVLSQVGVEITSVIAVLGAVGLAIGLAMQGALSNFAAGFILILFRPFKVGHFIEAGGVMGTVEEIHILYTELKTPANQKIFIPNSQVLGDHITNYSANDTRRAEWIFGIDYSDDMKKTREVLKDIIEKDDRILKDPAPSIFVKELGDSSVNFCVRAWANNSDYWSVYWDIIETVKGRFDEENLSFPFPQRDVHLFQASSQ